jgi:ubiquinone/menaquinone biosynthesis C-methylase UbiE
MKLFFELAFWKFKKSKEGSLGNMHYKYFFTTYFSIPESFYHEKRVLDIGCGPRGSLEWADMAKERYGIDPLADRYLKMGASRQKMQYIKGDAEALPFESEYFDVISSFN